MIDLTVKGYVPEVYFFCKAMDGLVIEGVGCKIEIKIPYPELVTDKKVECHIGVELEGDE